MTNKEIILSVLSVIFSFIFWLLLSYSLIWQSIIIFIIFSSFWCLSAILLSKNNILLISFLSILGSLLIIPLSASYFILISLLFSYLAYLRINKEKDILLKFKVNKIISHGFVFYLIAFALLISVAYFYTPGLELANLQGDLIKNLDYINKIKYIPPEVLPMLKEKISQFFAENSWANAVPYGLTVSLFLTILALTFIFSKLTIVLVSVMILVLKKIGIVTEQEKECQKIIIKF